MTGFTRVRGLITRLAPVGICDGCVKGLADLQERAEASSLARQLIGLQGYERKTAKCGMCEQVRQITRKAG